jgi:hypothetical protein
MSEITSRRTARFTRKWLKDAAFRLLALGALGIVVSVVAVVVSLAIAFSDSNCAAWHSDCGGAPVVALGLVVWVSLRATAAFWIGAVILFILSTVAPKDDPSKTEGAG